MSSSSQDTPPSTPSSPSAQSEDSLGRPPDIAPELGSADLTLHCDDEVWYLHKAPLCARSGYFWKKAREPRNSNLNHVEVDIQEGVVNPDVIWIVVEWCYYERVDLNATCPDRATFSPVDQEEVRLERSMLLWAAAEELEVVGLKEALWTQAYSSPLFFETPGPNGAISIPIVFRIIRTVYEYTPEPLTLGLRIVTQNMESHTDVPELAARALVRETYGDDYEHLYRRRVMRSRHLLFRWLSMHFNIFSLPISTFTRDFDQFKLDVATGQGKCPFCKQRWALDLQSGRISERCSTCGARSTVDEWAYHEDIVFRND